MRKIFLLIARTLFSLIFISAGVSQLYNWSETTTRLAGAFCQWQMYFESSAYASDNIRFCVSITPFLIGIAIFLEVVGGLLILSNYKMRLGAFFLLIFLVPTTLIFHSFWLEIGEGFHIQLELLLKNLSIIGALLYFLIRPQEKKATT